VTIEDGLIGTSQSGLRGFAGYASSLLSGSGVSLSHLGIADPGIAPSDHFAQLWEHWGITAAKLAERIVE